MIPTEPIGSIPRPTDLIDAIEALGDGTDARLEPLYDAAIEDTVRRFEATGSPVITDGEQRKYHNFWTYSVEGLPNTKPDGFRIPFAAGHVRRMPRLTAGRFRYQRYADKFLSLMYPADGIEGYSREEFINVTNFYVSLASERDRASPLETIGSNLKPEHRVFVGVVAPIDPRLESPEIVRDRVVEAARYTPLEQLGTTDDCGFAPFCDDKSTSRDLAFAKIRARVAGTALAGRILGTP